MILLSPVIVAGIEYHHTWVHGDKDINKAYLGDTVSFFSKLKVYEHGGKTKWCPNFPYEYVQITRGKGSVTY